MADIDPNKMLRVAIEELRDAVNKSIELKTVEDSPTYQIRQAREKGLLLGQRRPPDASGIGDWASISQAEAQPQIGPDPELHEASEPPDAVADKKRSRGPWSKGKKGRQEGRRENAEAQPGGNMPDMARNTGIDEKELEAIKNEPLTIPEYKYKLDETLRISRDLAIKTAQKAGEPQHWMPGDLQVPAEGLAKVLQQGYQYAAPIESIYHLTTGIAKKFTDQAYAGAELGTSLGYSPQGGIGGAYIAGIRNPLAAFTSEAGRQGLGQKVGALGAMFGGGISLGQAEGLRNALSQEGFSNQKEGAAGLFTGGENEALSEALEPSVKEGLSPEIAAGFGEVTRYGTSNVKRLREALQGLGSTAKTLKLNIDQTADSMQKYASEVERGGGMPIHGLETFKTLAGASGILPNKILEVGESPLGVATTVGQGYFPGTLPSQSALAQAQVAKKTVDRALSYIHGHTTYTTNSKGERVVSQDSEENAIAQASQIFQLNPQMIQAFKERGGQIVYSAEALERMKSRQQEFANKEPFEIKKREEEHPELAEQYGHAQNVLKEKQEHLHRFEKEQKERFEKKHKGEILPGEEIEESQEERHEKSEAKLAVLKAKEHADKLRHAFVHPHNKEKEGKKDWAESWHEAAKAGVTADEGKEAIKVGHNWQEHIGALMEKVSEKNQIKGAEEEGKGIIELSPEAKRFFKLNMGNKYKEETNAGGPSGAQNSATPYQQGRYPNAESIEKEGIRNAEKSKANKTTNA